LEQNPPSLPARKLDEDVRKGCRNPAGVGVYLLADTTKHHHDAYLISDRNARTSADPRIKLVLSQTVLFDL
jgi:hypothetical protein